MWLPGNAQLLRGVAGIVRPRGVRGNEKLTEGMKVYKVAFDTCPVVVMFCRQVFFTAGVEDLK